MHGRPGGGGKFGKLSVNNRFWVSAGLSRGSVKEFVSGKKPVVAISGLCGGIRYLRVGISLL